MKSLDFDILMLALPRWDGRYSSTAFSLAQALSVHTRVFYIDNPFTVKDYLLHHKSNQIKKRKKALLKGKDIFTAPDKNFPNLVAVTPKVVYPINWLPPGGLYDFLSGWNDAIVYRALKKTIDAYNIQKFVFINSFNPLYGRFFPKSFKPELTLYHCVDDISKSEYIAKHGTRLESDAVRKADFTIVTSMELKRLKSADSDKVYYLPNAANVELFQQALENSLQPPDEIKRIAVGKKIIVYVGNICHRLDYELLNKIARQHRDKILLMVGPLSNDNYKKAGLDKLSNVMFIGSKPLEKLPAYLKYADCCIIPFLCIQLTKSIYPLKINEYLSAGKPVVTTDFSEDIANFGPVAYVSSTHEEFLWNIDVAIESDSEENVAKRVAFSSANNWTARANQLIEIINDNTRPDDKRRK